MTKLETVPQYLRYIADNWDTIEVSEDMSKYDPKAEREYKTYKIDETPLECQLKWVSLFLRQGYIERA